MDIDKGMDKVRMRMGWWWWWWKKEGKYEVNVMLGFSSSATCPNNLKHLRNQWSLMSMNNHPNTSRTILLSKPFGCICWIQSAYF